MANARMTGTCAAAIARATPSSLNAQRSSMELSSRDNDQIKIASWFSWLRALMMPGSVDPVPKLEPG